MIKKIRNFFRILRKILKLNKELNLKKIIPEITDEEIKLINSINDYSMTPLIRRWFLIKSIHYINRNRLKGDIVECGVWKGGNLFLSKKINDLYNIKRKYYGFDTFDGMPPPGKYEDVKLKKIYKNNQFNWVIVPKKDVENFAKKNFKNISEFRFIKGKVEKTLKDKKNLPKKISLLRLDTDWYDSTKVELDILYPKLIKGGILIIDDYGDMKGAKKAVDEFFKNKKIFLIRIDQSCRMVIKN
jgi:O-methyltransferase